LVSEVHKTFRGFTTRIRSRVVNSCLRRCGLRAP